MITKSELLTKILTTRIISEKAKGTTDFTSIQETMDIFLAGDKITTEQYATLTELIMPITVAS